MSNLLNIDAETGADIIGDDSQPSLTIWNSGGGFGLQTRGLVNVSTASIDVVHTTALRTSSATSGVVVTQTVVGNMSIGILKVVGNSVASGAALEFSNKAFASITSVVLTTVANTDYAIRVQVGNQTRWIPLFKDAAIIGAAAF